MAEPDVNFGKQPFEFQQDRTQKKKKGAHAPVFAPLFSEKPSTKLACNGVHIFINPYAGKKQGNRIAAKFINDLQLTVDHIVQYHSQYAGHLIELAEKASIGDDEVIAVIGGDGTLCEVMSGRKQQNQDRKERYAIIPAGTGNSHAYDLGIYTPEDGLSALLSGVTQSIDLARVHLTGGLPGNENGPIVRYSHNLVTWGLGVDSTIQAEKMRWLGPSRYDIGIVMAILRNKKRRATLSLDGKAVTDDFTLFLIQNTQTGGSMLPLAPGAQLDDGRMDIGILRQMSRRQIFKAFGMLKKEGRHVFHPKVDYYTFNELTISTSEPTAINIDGENIGSTPLTMCVEPASAHICVLSK